jgi:hypothetical protein
MNSSKEALKFLYSSCAIHTSYKSFSSCIYYDDTLAMLCLLPDSCCLLVWLPLQPWRLKRHVPPKRRLTNRLHGIISYNTEFFNVVLTFPHLTLPPKVWQTCCEISCIALNQILEWTLLYSWIWHCVAWCKFIDISEEPNASIFRAEE